MSQLESGEARERSVEPIRRLVFFGTPELSARYLRALRDDDYEVVLAVTRQPKRRGRGGLLTPSPVEAAARELGVPVSYDMHDAVEMRADLGLVVAYGRIIPTTVLEHCRLVNVHYSLLPRYRGAAPMERAILNGDEVSGVSLMEVSSGLDEGEVYDSVEVLIRDLSLSQVEDLLTQAGIAMVRRALQGGRAWLSAGVAQSGEVTYAGKLKPEEYRIDWTRSAEELVRVVRLERAYCFFDERRLRVEAAATSLGCDEASSRTPGEIYRAPDGRWLVACGDGSALEVVSVRPEGRRSQGFREFVWGLRTETPLLR